MPQLLNNRYQVISTIGSGGFGETFLAEDTYMPSARRCVIKQLKPVASNSQIHKQIVERFRREAAILEELGQGSSQIPCLYAYFVEAGQFYLVQEFIEGLSLTDLITQSGKQNESFVKKILSNLLPVINYVHSKGIVHRDIKPDNIMLRSFDNQPVLIDFGAVRETMGTIVNSQGNTASSIVIGTPGFMPSEQAAGRPTFASDIYALGLTAIYLLTAKNPQELETDPLSGEIIWKQHAPSISPSFASFLEKAVKEHGRDRFPTSQIMLEALQTDATSIPPTITSSPPSTHQVASTLISPVSNSSQKGMVIGGTIAGALISGSILAGFIISSNSSKQITETAVAPKVVESSPSTAKTTDTDKQSSTEISRSLAQSTPKTVAPQEQAIKSTKLVTSKKSQLKDYYFVADSAFADTKSASEEVSRLQARGYSGAGMFWIKDYPNLSNKSLYQVYPAKFRNRASCKNFLQTYARINSQAYCVFGSSSNRNASPDRFYAN